MKPSKELQSQLERLKTTGSFTVSIILKQELARLVKAYGYNELLNLDCGTCVRQAMHNVNSYLNQLDQKPVLSMKKQNISEEDKEKLKDELSSTANNKVIVSFKDSEPILMTMEKKPAEMTFQELRKAVKAKGIKTSKNPNKKELIKLLS